MSRVTEKRTRGPRMLPHHWWARRQWWGWIYDACDVGITDGLEAWRNRPRIGDTRPATGPVEFKVRDHFQADGRPKLKRSLGAAQRYCQKHPNLMFYRCSVCNAYHLGHRNGRRNKRAA